MVCVGGSTVDGLREVHADAFVSLADVRPHMGAAAATLLAAGVAVEGVGTCGFPLCLVADRPELLRSLVPLMYQLDGPS